MMNNIISKMIFINMMLIGTLITISSSSWLSMWIGLEINLLFFIPLMIDQKNIFSNEATIKYFLIQIFASMMFLFTSLIYMMKINLLFNLNFIDYENTIINLMMMMKLGAAPFHFWFPNIIEGLSWNNSLLILTWQKFAPMMIISYSKMNKMIIFFMLMSAFIGAINGLNQTSLRKLMAFSSINHISWMLMSLLLNNIYWMFYFMIYTMMNMSIIMNFKMINIFNMNQLFLFNNHLPLIKFNFMMNFLSLGGLPPFLGFFPKWIIIENLIINKNFFMVFFCVMMTLMTLFFYIRMTFSALLFNYSSYSWNFFYFNKNFLLIMNLMLNFLLMMFFFNMINNYYLM